MRKRDRLVAAFFVLPLVAALLFSFGAIIKPAGASSTPVVKVDPPLVEYFLNAVGREFTVAVKIFNVTNLYGFDVKLRWNTTVLDYVSHSIRVPRNTYANGLLWNPVMQLANAVNTTAGTYWIGYTSLAPADSFNGTGTAFTMTFRVKYHPVEPEPDADITLELYSTDLAAKGGGSITHTKENGRLILYALPPISTILYVEFEGKRFFRRSQGAVFTLNVNIENITDLYAFAINLDYNTTLLDVSNVTEGSFLKSRGPTQVVKNYVNDTEGRVRYALSLLGTPSGANGSGTLFSITFTATTATLGTSNLTLPDLADPLSRDLSDYNANPIDHAIMDGSVEILEVEVLTHISGGYTFVTASSSSVSAFAYNNLTYIASFNVTGPTDIPGFTNVTIPEAAMNLSANDMFIVLFDGVAKNHTMTQNSTHYFVHLTYSHSSYRIEIKQTLIGDLNADRTVSMADVVIICVAFDSNPSLSHWNPVADLKKNNQIDIFDVVMVTRNYDKTWTPP